MNEQKYYIPTEEEFHVGFEYEIESREGWIKKTWELHEFSEGRFRSNLPYIRVKYLNKEDIESLGWEHDCESPSRYEYQDYILFNFNNSNIFTIKVEEKYIKHQVTFVKFETLFEGIIKNKSELIKLIKQLNIE